MLLITLQALICVIMHGSCCRHNDCLLIHTCVGMVGYLL